MKLLNLSQFNCLGCGACCRQDGYVRLKKNEPDIIASYLNMDVFQFIETYTRLTKDRQTLSLIDKDNGECIFLTAKGCCIHNVKPLQCLEFPFKWKFKAFETICAWAKKELKK
ncbi:MAG: YkgJ family cysteine cluster protein [Proteobacteria bacterium]|nr:YkgJ family cysteine cluster protein [Pseudomonadota bacterium]MBU1581636.1 YkgJ family cysteine cluster protein [Pseudomonadota bacterium]MBU2453234.1 YkgJ family cysteine cluster protein [Pseudomonadota bacterium]